MAGWRRSVQLLQTCGHRTGRRDYRSGASHSRFEAGCHSPHVDDQAATPVHAGHIALPNGGRTAAPASDAAIVQLRTFARYGSRVEGSVLRHLPDSALVSGPPAPLMLESGATTVPAWSVALLDDHDAVAGVATVTGGVTRTTFWSSAAAARPEWPTMLSQLRSALDRSAPGGTGDGVRTVLADSSVRPDDRQASRGRLNRPEMLVTSRGMLLVQAARTTRADGRLAFGQVAVTDGRQVGVGPTVAAALTSLGETLLPTPGGPVATAIPEDAIGSEGAGRWYDAMRQAMKQGNWSAFGAAFDSLGRALGRPPR